jgi:RNA polymerase sigma-70 factor (ECF subfamily)
MPATCSDDTDELLDRTGRGDDRARDLLMARHRARLRTMIAVRMDPRFAARVDPSDIVQEALADANQLLTV